MRGKKARHRALRLAVVLLFERAGFLPLHAVESPPPGALACTSCHHLDGVALPSLRWLSADQIATAMRQFRTNERPATLMNRIAKGFNEEETNAIAIWLAARRGKQ